MGRKIQRDIIFGFFGSNYHYLRKIADFASMTERFVVE